MSTRIVMALFLSLGTVVTASGEIDFNRDIRPILSENCIHCHGPDGAERKAGLRLDTFEGGTEDHGGVRAITPGQLEGSELWHRIWSDDLDEVMPPPDSKRLLTQEQKLLLNQWIESGAEYDDHWAFVKPEAREGTIDGFVAKKAAEVGVSLSLKTDRRTLARRSSLDLIGLPPSREAVEDFLKDERPDAYERWINDLMASPRFGERWARPWLDLARYADSNGFQADQLRDSWAYRDWVIEALNNNMPFDQFSIEQLAGDLLPGATVDQKIATGFHRTVTCNVEAGVHVEQNRVNQVVDRVNTTATVWLGLTMECAQCHDHKYDPLSQKEYFQLFDFFNQTPVEVRNPSGEGVSYDFYGPKMDLPMSPDDAATLAGLKQRKADLEAERKRVLKDPASSFESWLVSANASLANDWVPLKVVSFETTGSEDHRELEDGSILVTGNIPGNSVYSARFNPQVEELSAIKVEALTHSEIPGNGPGRGDAKRTNFILSEFEVRTRSGGEKREWSEQNVVLARADYSQPNWQVSKAIDGDRKTGWAIGPQFGKPHWAVFGLEKPIAEDTSLIEVTLDQNFGRGRTIGRVRFLGRSGPVGFEFAEDVKKILTKEQSTWSKAEKTKLEKIHRESNPTLVKLDKDILAVTKQVNRALPPTTLVMVEQEEKRDTHVMRRGDYLDPQEKVTAGTPEVLHGWPDDLEPNRLGLARWLMSKENPLVARVTVNRYWAELFGRGIVETVEDFGAQASLPTHPTLLDWLAVEFMESGWDVKALLKTIVMSETYQRDSRMSAEQLELDPKNLWLGRGARFRLNAERIRDNALTVSGLLSDTMFGEPIMPYQPNGIWRQVGRNEPKWVEQKDENRWRRGIYIVYRRAAPYPSMVNFDAPDRGMCTVKRGRTNTPLQALTMLNDPVYAEMAMALADRILVEGKGDIGFAFETVVSRPPTDRELEIVKNVLAERRSVFETDEAAARALVDGTKAQVKLRSKDEKELAAWFHVANAMLNLDETMTRE